MERLHARFLALADAKKQVYDDDLHALVADEIGTNHEAYHIEGFQVTSGIGVTPTATVRLRSETTTVEESATGDGPVDAGFHAIDRITGMPVTLLEYRLNATTAEKDALGEAYVLLEHEGRTASAHAASTDVVEASIRAYVNAINRLVAS
jgi:2-isopropylmalate synthase